MSLCADSSSKTESSLFSFLYSSFLEGWLKAKRVKLIILLFSSRVQRKPTWGTCAGLILLAESANKTKKGGQELIGGLDVRVNRNHFGRQTESFQTRLTLPFLCSEDAKDEAEEKKNKKKDDFPCFFIRAPVVEKVLPCTHGEQVAEERQEDIVTAPPRTAENPTACRAMSDTVEVLATLKPRAGRIEDGVQKMSLDNRNEEHGGDIVAVRQGNVFGTSFHPELTGDERVHMWWLKEVEKSLTARQIGENS